MLLRQSQWFERHPRVKAELDNNLPTGGHSFKTWRDGCSSKCIETSTDSKKEEYVPNTRIRSDLNETKISDLSDRVQNKGH